MGIESCIEVLKMCAYCCSDVGVSDIKPDNVFITSKGGAKLGDLGLGRLFSTFSTHAASTVGTPYYMSPELVSVSQAGSLLGDELTPPRTSPTPSDPTCGAWGVFSTNLRPSSLLFTPRSVLLATRNMRHTGKQPYAACRTRAAV